MHTPLANAREPPPELLQAWRSFIEVIDNFGALRVLTIIAPSSYELAEREGWVNALRLALKDAHTTGCVFVQSQQTGEEVAVFPESELGTFRSSMFS